MAIHISSTFFGVVACLSVAGNTFFCVLLMVRRKSLLKKTYHILILNLAVTDICGGFFLFLTPNYVFELKSYPKMSGIGGEVFCRTVFSTYFLFVCGKASNASVMCLAIERWYAVVKPTKYNVKFGRRRLYTYIALIWISASITEVFELFIAKMVDGSCQWITPPYGVTAGNAFLVLHVTVTFYIPSVVTWVSFGHIWFRMVTNNAVGSQNQSTNARKNVVPMCALAAFFLTVLWFPTETFWVLKKYEVVILPHIYYLVFNLLAFVSSCINPFIYCLSNKTYRREVVVLVDRLRCWDRSTRVVPFDSQTASATNDVRLRTMHVRTTVISEGNSVVPLNHMKELYIQPA